MHQAVNIYIKEMIKKIYLKKKLIINIKTRIIMKKIIHKQAFMLKEMNMPIKKIYLHLIKISKQ